MQQSCGTDVAVLDRNPEALRRVDAVLGNRVRTLFSTCDVVELLCPCADLVIATVLVPRSTAPKLITAQTVKAGCSESRLRSQRCKTFPQCDMSTGAVIDRKMVRVTPPNTNSRQRAWP